jgi:anti-anti-sigma factor
MLLEDSISKIMHPSNGSSQPIVVVLAAEELLLQLSSALSDLPFTLLCTNDLSQVQTWLARSTITMLVCDESLVNQEDTHIFNHIRTHYPSLTCVLLLDPASSYTFSDSLVLVLQKPLHLPSFQHIAKILLAHHQLTNKLKTQTRQFSHLQHQIHEETLIAKHIHQHLVVPTSPLIPTGLSVTTAALYDDSSSTHFYTFHQPLPHLFDIAYGNTYLCGINSILISVWLNTHLAHLAQPLRTAKNFNQHNQWHDDLLSPSELLVHLHRQVTATLVKFHLSSSLFYGRFNLQQRLFIYTDCGASKPLYYQADTGEVKILSGDNLPLGTSIDCYYTQRQLSFGKDDLFVFCSEQLIETTDDNGEIFGYARLKTLIQQYASYHPNILVQQIKLALNHFNPYPCDAENTPHVVVIKIDNLKAPTSTKHGLTAKFHSHLSQLKAVRSFIAKLCSNLPVANTPFLYQLQLAIDEIFTNIHRHGYAGLNGGIVTIQATPEEDGLVLDIYDQGLSFNPDLLEEPNLSGEQTHGFGWYIIKAVVDTMSYYPKVNTEGWNRLKLFKKYNQCGEVMKIEYTYKDKILIIKPLDESLDAKDSRLFKDEIIEYITQNDINTTIINLENINYIDSSGLGSLLSILKFLNTRNGSLKLAALNKPVKSIFELVAMHKVFSIYNTTDEALNSLTSH